MSKSCLSLEWTRYARLRGRSPSPVIMAEHTRSAITISQQTGMIQGIMKQAPAETLRIFIFSPGRPPSLPPRPDHDQQTVCRGATPAIIALDPENSKDRQRQTRSHPNRTCSRQILGSVRERIAAAYQTAPPSPPESGAREISEAFIIHVHPKSRRLRPRPLRGEQTRNFATRTDPTKIEVLHLGRAIE